LLTSTVELMKIMGWKHKTDIMEGFHIASTKLLNDLLVSEKDGENGGCVVATLPHPASSPEAMQELKEKVLKPVLGSKQYGSEGILADLIVEACQIVLNDKETSAVLQPSSIRTVKIMGGNVNQSACVLGFVAQRGVETTRTASEKNAKLVVYASGVEASSTEAKGTVLMKTADDLKNYNRTEETKMEEIIQGIAESGVKVIVTGGTISDMALHFIEKYELIALKLSSKWELRRLCQATGATALVRLGAPTAEEMGAATTTQKTVGGRTVTVFENDVDGKSKIATLVLRASTSSVLNDLERAVEDGVFAVQQACKDGRIVYGGGACEMECAVKLDQLADQHPGLEQYAIRAFAKSLECVARTLAENAGWDAVQVLSDMRAAHVNGNSDVGVDLENNPGSTSMKKSSASPEGVYDLMHVKRSALKLAVEAATTILKVDQIIMSKRAGGMGR
jgi:T-complex protein 1 subunit theta